MKYETLHPWNVTPKEAIQIQKKLASKIVIAPLGSHVRWVAGVDVSFDKGSNLVFAGIGVLEFPTLNLVETQGGEQRVDFPYVPGLLAFREGPPVLCAWEKLTKKPDVILFDGHGLAHPRRLGMASHLGVILNIPTIGCAKSVLVGKYQEPGIKAGCFSELVDKGEVVGAAVRTKDRVSPIFVTIGHRVDIKSAVDFVLKCTKGFRIPEPTRQAHLLVNAMRCGKLRNRFRALEGRGHKVRVVKF